MARRRTKREQEEYIWVHYGIERSSGTVRQVWQTRGGKLEMHEPDFTTKNTYLGPGRFAQHELSIVFGLSDTFQVRVELMDSEGTKQKLEALKKKAAALKADGSQTS